VTIYEPDDDPQHDVGVEFEEFFDLPIIDPEEVMREKEAEEE
jgi:hypothetical protein